MHSSSLASPVRVFVLKRTSRRKNLLTNHLLAAFTAGLVIVVSLIGTQATAQVVHSFTEPVERSELAAAEQGVVSRVLVREGEFVKEGQPLAELDNEVLEASLEIAELRANSDATVRAASAKLKIHKRNFERLQPLLQAGHANPAEVEKSKAEFDAAMAEYEIAREEVQEHRLEVVRIKAQIKRRIIHSPVNGWITEIHRRPGEYIASAEPRVATVVKLDQLRVRFYLSASEAQKLSIDQIIRLPIDDENGTAVAKVEFISPVTDPDSRTTRVDLLIDNLGMQFRSGTACHWPTADAVAASRRGQQP